MNVTHLKIYLVLTDDFKSFRKIFLEESYPLLDYKPLDYDPILQLEYRDQWEYYFGGGGPSKFVYLEYETEAR